MAGDYSRIRFNPQRHYSAVNTAQGRVGLDADQNENVAIQDRRWRAETVDVVGLAGVPSRTPDGFKIEIDGGGLTIGLGRIYVDGLLAENHGSSPWEFNTVLEEERGLSPVPIAEQPYSLLPYSHPSVAGRTLVYLDVWRRELTYLQEPDLVESAVDVDTTTRYQTVWQVRLLEDIDADVDCEMPLEEIPNWPDANLSSGARLSTATTEVSTETDPCIVPESGGYRGLGNQLYRVEVHSVSGGETLIKWSRENASVAANIVEVLSGRTSIRLDTLGRDEVLGFQTGDWVEITSDKKELAAQPGEMRQVTVNQTELTLTFTTALPAADYPAGTADEDEHWRVIRWDQNGTVLKSDGTVLTTLDSSSDGLIHLTAADNSVILENGVQITLDTSAGAAHPGDYWCFAARTADASVEELDQAPPLGVHHHYCHLAIAYFDGTDFVGAPHDCREVFLPLTELDPGCCTVVVEVGESIQAALDSLPPEGGCVCLKTGVHEISETLQLATSNVVIHGETPQTTIAMEADVGLMLNVFDPAGTTLENITVCDLRLVNNAIASSGSGIMFNIQNFDYVLLENCEFSLHTLIQNFNALLVNTGSNFTLKNCRFNNMGLGLHVIGDVAGVVVRENHFVAVTDGGDDGGTQAIYPREVSGACHIEGNVTKGFVNGILLNENSSVSPLVNSPSGSGSNIVGNHIVRLDTAVDNATDTKFFAIDAGATHCNIENNRIDQGASYHGGIRVLGLNNRICNNRIASVPATAFTGKRALGIQYGLDSTASADATAYLFGGIISDNVIEGDLDAVFIYNCDDAQLRSNKLQASTEGESATGIKLKGVKSASLLANTIDNFQYGITCQSVSDSSLFDNEIRTGQAGLILVAASGIEVSGNSISNMGSVGIFSLLTAGRVAFCSNKLANCAHSNPLLSVSLWSIFHLGELHIEANDILDTGVSDSGVLASVACHGIQGLFVAACQVQHNHVSYSLGSSPSEAGEHRALVMLGLLDYVYYNDQRKQYQSLTGLSALICGNKFYGPGHSSLVQIPEIQWSDLFFSRYDRVTFSHNLAWHYAQDITDHRERATLDVLSGSAIVTDNHFQSKFMMPSVNLNSKVKSLIYSGNIATADPINVVDVRPSPISAFNY